MNVRHELCYGKIRQQNLLMKKILRCVVCAAAATLLSLAPAARAQITGPIHLSITNGTKHLDLPMIPGVDGFKVLRSADLGQPFAPDATGSLQGYDWTESGQRTHEFFRLEITPKDPNDILLATALNRLAYGPTPDELARVKAMGVDAYIREQLAPETIEESLAVDRIVDSSDWQYVTVTGSASSSRLYLSLRLVGDCYIDDLKLVQGAVPEAGQNRIPNGDFESGLTGWTVSANVSNSAVSSSVKHGGTASLHLINTLADNDPSQAESIWRQDLGLITDGTYTLSYWFKPGTNKNSGLVIRLSGSGIVSSPAGSVATSLAENTATLTDLTAWHALHAIQSKKQLQEVLLQFLENHFVTQHRKSMDYFDRYYNQGEDMLHATNLEYRELQRWRQALQNPQVTFYDLLKISAESPAMIIYLDTVNSKGNGNNIANENYARELLELFTFGVDNGYDQNDITVMSRAWTGWTLRFVEKTNEFNPFAPQSETLKPGATNKSAITNLVGLWAFNYRASSHYDGEKVIFPGKTVPERFGAPYAGRNYELKLPAGGGAPTETDWQYVTMTGTATSSSLYIYLTGAGDCYLDDLKLVPGTVAEEGTNAIVNGGFDSSLAGWTVSPNHSGSSISTAMKKSGTGALHLVASAGGSTRGTSIYRADLGLAIGETYTLSYWYRPGTTMNGPLVIRLSSSSNGGIDSSPSSIYGIQDGYNVIKHLADQPFTQEYISVKLCRLFVHDDFAHGYDFTDPNLSAEGRLVRACMQAWEENMPKGQLRKVLEVIFNSELFRSQSASMQKVKTPFEFTVSAIRALRGRVQDGTFTADSQGSGIISPMNRMGRMRLFDRDDPDGYPEAGAPWISAGTLAERLRFVQALLIRSTDVNRGDAGTGNSTDPVKLLKDRLPAAAWNDAGAVADFFIGIIYPSEGRANIAEYRAKAIEYLNTADNGTTASLFSGLGNTSDIYQNRVRGMVATLMTYQRFQEQ